MCLVVDVQGFYIDGNFIVRELGWMDWQRRHGIERYRPQQKWESLNPWDEDRALFASKHLHGLPFEASKKEELTAKSQSEVAGDLAVLFKNSRVGEKKETVACKNHHALAFLKELDIPRVDLHLLGCPRFSQLSAEGFVEDVTCNLHGGGGLCALAKCSVLWNWIASKTHRPLIFV